jgi:hypothetical protein
MYNTTMEFKQNVTSFYSRSDADNAKDEIVQELGELR